MDKVIILLNFIADKVDMNRENLLTASCCAGHYLVDCFMSRVSQACKHKEGHEKATYLIEKINEMVAGTFDLACTKYPSLVECNKDHPQLMKDFENVLNEQKLINQTMSPLKPLVKIAHNLKIE